MLKSLLTAALLFTTLSTALAEDTKLVRTLSLAGHGEVHATPDLAIINMGVVSSAVTAREALDANTKAMIDLMAVLKSENVELKDISTSNFSVNSRFDYSQNNGQPPKVTGYDVSNSVSVTVRKLDMVGAILDRAVSSGSNQISGIQFSISNPQVAQDEARKEAVKDAKRKADLYAAAASVTLGNILSLSEGPAFQPPQPMMMEAKRMSADATNVPIAQGEQVIGADVNIAWEIK
jgi:uncharacterized protein